jgi:hypothetical protein
VHGPNAVVSGPYGQLFVSTGDGRLFAHPLGGDDWAWSFIASLAAGFVPGPMARAGEDLWVADEDNARIARLGDGAPFLTVLGGGIDGITVRVGPHGNISFVQAVATSPSGRRIPSYQVTNSFGGGPAPSSGTFTETLPWSEKIPAGDWAVTVTASNFRGSAQAPGPSFHSDYVPPVQPAPPAVVPPAANPSAAKPKPPKLSDLVSYATTKRCVPTRTLRLKLKARKAGQAEVARLKVTVGTAKAKTYTAKQLKKAPAVKGLPARGTAKVKVVATLSDGTSVSQTLAYKRCAAKAKNKG